MSAVIAGLKTKSALLTTHDVFFADPKRCAGRRMRELIALQHELLLRHLHMHFCIHSSNVHSDNVKNGNSLQTFKGSKVQRWSDILSKSAHLAPMRKGRRDTHENRSG